MTNPVIAAFSAALQCGSELPADIQYMPPGKHRINASRGGRPVSLEITVDASTAATLNAFLNAQLAKTEEGNEDCPYFDFNHEDREASAWPTEFYWAGDDPKTGGVRAKVEWSGAGKNAIEQKTFRRFSPTFIPDKLGRVVGSTTNMGGLVNRAAFKSIAPLFARETYAENPQFMNTIVETLNSLGLITCRGADLSDSNAVESLATELKTSIASLRGKLEEAETKAKEASDKLDSIRKAHVKAIVEDAVTAGRIAPKDEATKSFWTDALERDETAAVKALEALPINPVLQTVITGDDPKTGALDKMTKQQRKIAEVQAANPTASFETVFAKAKSEAPQLFT